MPGTPDRAGYRPTADDSVYDEISLRRWFNDFDLPNGASTCSYLHVKVAPIHGTWLDMLWRVLDPVVQGRWREVSAIDVACHQGYFASHLARRLPAGAGRRCRAEHVDSARLIARAYNLANLRVEHQRRQQGLCGGSWIVRYHVDLRTALPRREPRWTPAPGSGNHPANLSGRDSGRSGHRRRGWSGGRDWTNGGCTGTFSIVDETGLTGELESNLTEISLCPSLDALLWVMEKVGFSRVEVVLLLLDAYEAHSSGSRVMVAAFVDERAPTVIRRVPRSLVTRSNRSVRRVQHASGESASTFAS